MTSSLEQAHRMIPIPKPKALQSQQKRRLTRSPQKTNLQTIPIATQIPIHQTLKRIGRRPRKRLPRQRKKTRRNRKRSSLRVSHLSKRKLDLVVFQKEIEHCRLTNLHRLKFNSNNHKHQQLNLTTTVYSTSSTLQLSHNSSSSQTSSRTKTPSAS